VAALAAVTVYWRTAFPTISWWENGELAAATGVLGVVHPPGALIPTIIGWLALRLPIGGSPAHLLNLLAGVVAGAVLLLAVLAGRRVRAVTVSETVPGATAGPPWVAALAALSFAFSRTFWSNGTLYTPYIFTALLTVSILLALLCWWRDADGPRAWRWTFLVLLLLGLDFSVHRTNMLLLPGVAIWALLRRPSVFNQLRHWAAGVAGLALGLSVHLLLLPIARSNPPLNSNDPSTLSRLWDYVSLKQYGGGFLVALLPRKGDFWSVQVADFVNGFRASFATADGALGPLGVVPLLLGLFGLAALWRSRPRLACGILTLFLLSSLGAIFYFNLPANYFRAMDRHYLPSFVLFAVLIIYGGLSLVSLTGLRRRRLAVITAGLLLALGGMAQAVRNWPLLDNSRTFFACDCGQNLLKTLPPQSILIAGTDVDTYPVWYLQMIEKERPDVTVANVNLLNTRWYLTQLLAAQTGLGFTMTPDEIAAFGFREWRDTSIAIPISRGEEEISSFAVEAPPDTVRLRVPPTVQGRYIRGHDDCLLRLIVANQWRRPILFTSFAVPQVGWLQPYLRPEGLVNRLMPVENPPVDTTLLIANLFSNYSYRGYNDPMVVVEPPSRWVAYATYAAFLTLADAMTDSSRCEALAAQMEAHLPLARIDAPEDLAAKLGTLCATRPAQSR
jgi:hypothetical protein